MTGQALMAKPGTLLREGLPAVLSLPREMLAADQNMNKPQLLKEPATRSSNELPSSQLTPRLSIKGFQQQYYTRKRYAMGQGNPEA